MAQVSEEPTHESELIMNHKIIVWGIGAAALLALGYYFIFTPAATAPVVPLPDSATSTAPTSTLPADAAPSGNSSGSTAARTSVSPIAKSQPQILLKVTYAGGVCPNGKTCLTEKAISPTGMYYRDEVQQYQLNRSDTSQLAKLINQQDFSRLRARPFTGTCPTKTGGQEVTYAFYTSKGLEKLSTCEFEIDFTSPIFVLIRQMIPAN